MAPTMLLYRTIHDKPAVKDIYLKNILYLSSISSISIPAVNDIYSYGYFIASLSALRPSIVFV